MCASAALVLPATATGLIVLRVPSGMIAPIGREPAGLPATGSRSRHRPCFNLYPASFAVLSVLAGSSTGVVGNPNVVDAPVSAPQRVPARRASTTGCPTTVTSSISRHVYFLPKGYRFFALVAHRHLKLTIQQSRTAAAPRRYRRTATGAGSCRARAGLCRRQSPGEPSPPTRHR